MLGPTRPQIYGRKSWGILRSQPSEAVWLSPFRFCPSTLASALHAGEGDSLRRRPRPGALAATAPTVALASGSGAWGAGSGGAGSESTGGLIPPPSQPPTPPPARPSASWLHPGPRCCQRRRVVRRAQAAAGPRRRAGTWRALSELAAAVLSSVLGPRRGRLGQVRTGLSLGRSLGP